jgi:hypothetical protein
MICKVNLSLTPNVIYSNIIIGFSYIITQLYLYFDVDINVKY